MAKERHAALVAARTASLTPNVQQGPDVGCTEAGLLLLPWPISHCPRMPLICAGRG